MPTVDFSRTSVPAKMTRKLKVYCLAKFTDDEADEIQSVFQEDSYDSYSSSDIRLDLIPWTQGRDGGKEDVFRLFFENQEPEEDFMFFIDRQSLEQLDFLVADVRVAKSRYVQPQLATGASRTSSSFCAESAESITFGRCGGRAGWYGNPYSNIKKTYMSLTRGQVTLNEVLHRNSSRTSLSEELHWTSSVLDLCEETYSAQVRLATLQCQLLNREGQQKSGKTDDSHSRFGVLQIQQQLHT